MRIRRLDPKWREYMNTWREANKDRLSESYKQWSASNAKHLRQYRIENRHYFLARTRLRQARKLKATPSWLTQDHKLQIQDIYEQAVLAEKLTGVEHHVDHIEPLQGKDCCGLHVPWNLQVLPASENLSKGNRPVRHVQWKKL